MPLNSRTTGARSYMLFLQVSLVDISVRECGHGLMVSGQELGQLEDE